MRVLGIDPGIAKVGWGIIDCEKGNNTPIDYDCFETPKELNIEERLGFINQFMFSLISKYKPDVLAIEQLFFSTNTKTALTVAHARGVILLAASSFQIPVSSYTPLQIKQALTGYGKADKNQIQIMVSSLLKIPSLKQDDTADALAVALTYLFSQKMQSLQKEGFVKR